MIVFEKFGPHVPPNRQAERYAVGADCGALDPLRRLVEVHVMAAERLHGDDAKVPVLAQGKIETGRLWT